jgi:hypothetical protein
MCNFIHTPDVYMYTLPSGRKEYEGTYWKDENNEYQAVDGQYVSSLVEKWNQERHVEWLKTHKEVVSDTSSDTSDSDTSVTGVSGGSECGRDSDSDSDSSGSGSGSDGQ